MSEERTQAPSKRRRQQARERGLVARSPELTAAVGLLAAVALLGLWGDDLVEALVAAVRAPLAGEAIVGAEPAEVVARLRDLALGVAGPLLGVIGGVVAAVVTAHQVQVGGLWVPGLVAPDPQRLWGGGGAGGLGARVARGGWMLAKAAVVVGVAGAVIRAHLPAFDRLGGLEARALSRAAGDLLRGLTGDLALATLGLGLVDFLLQQRRIEAQLRATPEEQREDLRAIEGDPALRARRRQLVRAWRRDPAGDLAGAALVLTGPAGLSLVLAGGPPPRRVTVRRVARGPSGVRLRGDAGRAGVPLVAAPDLARLLARRPDAGSSPPAPLLAALAALWPPAGGTGIDGGRPSR